MGEKVELVARFWGRGNIWVGTDNLGQGQYFRSGGKKLVGGKILDLGQKFWVGGKILSWGRNFSRGKILCTGKI